jgi:hypothetical protein
LAGNRLEQAAFRPGFPAGGSEATAKVPGALPDLDAYSFLDTLKRASLNIPEDYSTSYERVLKGESA